MRRHAGRREPAGAVERPARLGRDERIVVNGAFRSQRVTGQQRYAGEIADRLVGVGAEEIVPGRFWRGSSIKTWLWSLLVLPFRARRAVLISLTARSPIWHPRHVLAVHDLFVLTNPEWYSRRYIWTHVPVLRLQLRFTAAVVAVSAPIADQVRRERIRASSVTLAPNAPSDLFAEASEFPELQERLDLRSDSFLLAIGSMDPRKNLQRLAQAWSQVPEDVRLRCPLAIVGGAAAIFAQSDINWPSGTVVAGYISDEELAGLYAMAKGVVFVSLAEGFGLPIVEAAAAGVRQFLLSDIDVFHWIAGDAATYVDPLSVGEMAAALQTVAASDGDSAGVIDVTRFAWDESAAAVMSAARRIAGYQN